MASSVFGLGSTVEVCMCFLYQVSFVLSVFCCQEEHLPDKRICLPSECQPTNNKIIYVTTSQRNTCVYDTSHSHVRMRTELLGNDNCSFSFSTEVLEIRRTDETSDSQRKILTSKLVRTTDTHSNATPDETTQ